MACAVRRRSAVSGCLGYTRVCTHCGGDFTTRGIACLLVVVLVLIPGVRLCGGAATVPPGPIPPSALLAHFPDCADAAVWRNWHAIEAERIAKVLGTSVENVWAMADSMGLPPQVAIPPEQKSRGYFWMTLCRRNWHLLPIEQLAALLDTTPEKLMNFLRVEETANWFILGGFKPECAPIRYEPPSAEVRQRAARIKQIVQADFGEEICRLGQPRFEFVRHLSRMQPCGAPPPQPVKRLLAPRFLCSYLKIYGDPLSDPQVDMYPEGLLQRLAEVGVDGVWLYGVLRELAPGGSEFPEFGQGQATRLANLNTLVQRARKHGIGVYLYLNEPRAMPEAFFKNRPNMAGVKEGEYTALCTSNPAVRQWISDALAHVFREVPNLAGVFTITASENLTNCASHYQWKQCPHCRNRSDTDILAEINATIEEGVHRGNPKASVIAWDWGWRGNADASDIIARLPKAMQLMSVSEWDLPIERGGIKSRVGEYSLSSVGPGPRAVRHWRAAQAAGLKTIAKVQLNNSWELSSLPYLPVMDLVAEHCDKLASAGVDGMMLGWSLGGYPSPNLEIAERFSRAPTPSMEEALDAVAQSRFDPAGTTHAQGVDCLQQGVSGVSLLGFRAVQRPIAARPGELAVSKENRLDGHHGRLPV